jgi:hypothetical protein
MMTALVVVVIPDYYLLDSGQMLAEQELLMQ